MTRYLFAFDLDEEMSDKEGSELRFNLERELRSSYEAANVKLINCQNYGRCKNPRCAPFRAGDELDRLPFC